MIIKRMKQYVIVINGDVERIKNAQDQPPILKNISMDD